MASRVVSYASEVKAKNGRNIKLKILLIILINNEYLLLLIFVFQVLLLIMVLMVFKIMLKDLLMMENLF